MILFQSINQPYEFAEPDKKIQTGYSTKQIHSLPATKLKEILKKHQVQNNNVKVAELRDRVLHLQTKGLVGLPRAKKPGSQDKGGPKRPFRSTVYDVVEFFDSFSEWWKQRYQKDKTSSKYSLKNLASKTVILDNASTHASIRVQDTKHKSIFHRLAKERWGLKNIIYQPPRSPQFQPAETFFAYQSNYRIHDFELVNRMWLFRISQSQQKALFGTKTKKKQISQ